MRNVRLATVLGVLLGQVVMAHGADTQVLSGARIVTAPGRVIEKGSILIRDGLIEAVGESLPVPFDAEVFDVTGLIVYAGFIDAGAALGLGEVKHPQGPAEGAPVDLAGRSIASTRVANRKGTFPDLQASTYLKLDRKGGEAHRKAGFTSVLVTPTSQLISGQSVLVNLTGAPRRDAIIARPVAMHASFRGPRGGYPGSLMGVIAHLRQTFLDAQHHRQLKDHYSENTVGSRRPPFDPALDALVPVLDRVLPLAFRADSAHAIGRVLRLAREFDLSIIIDGGGEAWKMADVLLERHVPVLLHLSIDKEPELPAADKVSQDDPQKAETQDAAKQEEGAQKTETRDAAKQEEGAQKAETQDAAKQEEGAQKAARRWDELPPKERFAEPRRVLEERHRLWREQAQGAAQLAAKGVPFAFTTQGSKPSELMKDLVVAMREGLGADDALRALTVTPARLCGVQRQLGSIEPGKIANLTILQKPLGEEKNAIAYVVVDGERIEIAGKPKKKEDDGKKTEPGKTPESGAEKTTGIFGRWAVTIDADFGQIEFTWELFQDDGRLTGKMFGRMGDGKLESGSYEDGELTLKFTFELDDQPMEITFTGKVSGDSASGKVSSRMGDSEWNATRLPDREREVF